MRDKSLVSIAMRLSATAVILAASAGPVFSHGPGGGAHFSAPHAHSSSPTHTGPIYNPKSNKKISGGTGSVHDPKSNKKISGGPGSVHDPKSNKKISSGHEATRKHREAAKTHKTMLEKLLAGKRPKTKKKVSRGNGPTSDPKANKKI
jgi:hypothetical protein